MNAVGTGDQCSKIFPNAHKVHPLVMLDMVDKKLKNFPAIHDYYKFFNEIIELISHIPGAIFYVYPQPIDDITTDIDIRTLLFYERLTSYMKIPSIVGGKNASQIQFTGNPTIGKEGIDITVPHSGVKIGFLEIPGYTNRIKNPHRFIEPLKIKINTAVANTIQHCGAALQIAEDQKDLLTGLYSRKHGTHIIEKKISTQLKNGESIGGVIFLDIDNFKSINDDLGHDSGDMALKMVSSILQEAVSDEDVAVRFGGEELVIYCPGKTLDQTHILACAINMVISEFDFTELIGRKMVTASIGVSNFQGIDTSIAVSDIMDRGVRMADLAMYYVKQNGKNGVTQYAPILEEQATSKNTRRRG